MSRSPSPRGRDDAARIAALDSRAGRVPRGLPTPPTVTTLRLSVTDRCDLRCRYCMPGAGAHVVPRRELPSLEDLAGVVEWLAAELGIERVRLTGGEPLLRRGVPSLVRRLAVLPGVAEVSMTSNGTRLAERAQELADAGLARVNVSLDTLDRDRFRALTRGGDLERVLAGIAAARAAGLTPLKLNAVLRKSSWRDDVPALLDFAAAEGLEIRFIELMRTGTGAAWSATELLSAATVRRWLEEQGRVSPLPTPRPAPARRSLVRWRSGEVVVGWITAVSRPFCGACDRLRLDVRGGLRRCLMDPEPLALLPLLGGGREDEARAAVAAYLAGKRAPAAMRSSQPMRAIGG